MLFALVWLTTFGRHHFWLLPNLTEDVGFFESFKPFYKHDVCKKDKKPDKASGSDGSGAASDDSVKDHEEEVAGNGDGDNDNGYEMVDREEVAHVEDVALGGGGEETKKTK